MRSPSPITPPPSAPAADDVARLVLAVLPALKRHMSREMRERGAISVERFKALRGLEAGPMRSGALADHVRLSPAALTRVADGLVADGFVIRIEDRADRRAVGLALTESGRAELLRSERVVIEALDDLLGGLTPMARARLAVALEDLRAALEPNQA